MYEGQQIRASLLSNVVMKNSYMASNLSSINAEDTFTPGSAPRIASINTAGTKRINLSLKMSVIVPPRNIRTSCLLQM